MVGTARCAFAHPTGLNHSSRRHCERGNDDVKTQLRIPAAGNARVMHRSCPSEREGAGNAGCRPHPQPRVQIKRSTRASSPQVRRTHSGIPCAMVLRLIPCSPRGTGLVSPRRTAKISRSLTPASGCQDHTALPSALASLASRHQSVHRILTQRPWRLAVTPPPEGSGRTHHRTDFHSDKQKYFFKIGLDTEF
jgi:hypothetical protein